MKDPYLTSVAYGARLAVEMRQKFGAQPSLDDWALMLSSAYADGLADGAAFARDAMQKAFEQVKP